MKIKSLTIDRWNNLRDLHLEVPEDASFICLVGENGTGKSTVLELLTWAAHHLGLAPGLPLKRPMPQIGRTDYGVEVTISVRRIEEIRELARPTLGGYGHVLPNWDGTLTVRSHGWSGATPPAVPPGTSVGQTSDGGYWLRVDAGGFDDNVAPVVGGAVAQAIRALPELLHLYLDAERIFPPQEVADQEVLAFARQDLTVPDWLKNQAAQLTQNLYLEWMRHMLGRQQRLQTEYYQHALEASRHGDPPAPPEDPLAAYRDALAHVLPHLRFVRLDQERRRLIFDSAGEELPYEQLSGGERELAFLVGQIDRFGLRDGVFLLDEPELHLNTELLRGWLDFLRSTVREGQAWVATHALEAAEVAGPAATIVLEREPDRIVRRAVPLHDRPALATLATALGTPAFSVGRSRFILIEGTRERRERERFAVVLDTTTADRFIEADGCEEVLTRVSAIRLLASEEEQLRIAGVVDRDFRTEDQREQLRATDGVFVLPVHEIENFFLQPELLGELLEAAGRSPDEALTLLQDGMDPRAVRWAFEKSRTEGQWEGDLSSAAREAGRLTWDDVATDTEPAATTIAAQFTDVTDLERARRRVAVQGCLTEYSDLRDDLNELWKRCFGKEVLASVARALGFSDTAALEQRAAVLWKSGQLARPEAAQELREYLDSVPVLA